MYGINFSVFQIHVLMMYYAYIEDQKIEEGS